MATSTPVAEEVSRVNKLLQIEDLAWSRQLEKAVGLKLQLFARSRPQHFALGTLETAALG